MDHQETFQLSLHYAIKVRASSNKYKTRVLKEKYWKRNFTLSIIITKMFVLNVYSYCDICGYYVH